MSEIDKIIEPIKEWYGGGTEGERTNLEILADAIADLQDNRKELFVLQTENKQLKSTQESLRFEVGFVKKANEQLQAKNKLLREQNRWIPVSERLPKDEYSILAYGIDGYGYKIVANTSYNLEFEKFRILSEVTHWKPIILPEQALKDNNVSDATI